MKRWKFFNRYGFSQKELEIFPSGRGLTKKG